MQNLKRANIMVQMPLAQILRSKAFAPWCLLLSTLVTCMWFWKEIYCAKQMFELHCSVFMACTFRRIVWHATRGHERSTWWPSHQDTNRGEPSLLSSILCFERRFWKFWCFWWSLKRLLHRQPQNPPPPYTLCVDLWGLYSSQFRGRTLPWQPCRELWPIRQIL